MRSPFPGMDPYLESPKFWSSFHVRFITHLSESLTEQLPRHYVAQLEERVQLVRPEDLGDVLHTRPDSSILGLGPRRAAPADEPGGAVAVLPREPSLIPLEMPEEAIEETTRFIRIVRYPGATLVAVLELLSPSNKVEPGRSEYLANRDQWLRQPVHLIELDLLVKGKRLPMRGALPQGDDYAFVTRWRRRPDCEVYAWSVREPLPMIRIPLDALDPDLVFDFQPLFTRVFERGFYDRYLDYDHEPLEAPFAESDREWVRRQAQARDQPAI